MKTLATFSEAMGAQLLRTRLEGNGITAYVLDENMAALAAYAIGGIRVDVADEDYDEAVRLMAEEPE